MESSSLAAEAITSQTLTLCLIVFQSSHMKYATQQRHNAVTMATVKMSLKFFDYILIDLISNFFESTKELIVKSKPWLASWSDFLRYGY